MLDRVWVANSMCRRDAGTHTGGADAGSGSPAMDGVVFESLPTIKTAHSNHPGTE